MSLGTIATLMVGGNTDKFKPSKGYPWYITHIPVSGSMQPLTCSIALKRKSVIYAKTC